MSIYTRTGDTGTTALFGGKRVLKCEELVDVYGSLDELNSWVGMIAAQIEDADVQQFLAAIQSDLFTIGSVLAGWKGSLAKVEKRVPEMEARIDAMEKDLPKLSNFILPGGSELGAHVHVARSICRRVERQMVALFQGQTLKDKGLTLSVSDTEKKILLKYLNRLSDLFFMLARFINANAGAEEVSWMGIPRDSD
jgi:cob(I)alamin adenosyltransferase